MKWLFFILPYCPFSLLAQNDIRFENLTVDDGLSYNLVFEIIQDQEGYVWFGTVDGLNRYDGHDFTTFKQEYGDTTSLPDNSIWALSEDRYGVIWVGTDGGGLSRFDKDTERFVTYENLENDQKSLSHNSVNAILEDSRKNLWLGTYGGGLNLMDRNTGYFERFLHNKNDSTSLSSDYIHFLFEDDNDNLWIGTSQGLNRYSYESKTFTRYGKDDGFINQNILAIEEYQGKLWLGSWGGGLIVFDPQDKSLTNKTLEGDWTSNKIAAVYKDSEDIMWAGFLGNGLSQISGNMYHYKNDPLDKNSLVNNDIWFIKEDNQNNLWVGTEGGVSKIPGNHKPFFSVTKNQGFAGLQVYDFERDHKGRYWVATDDGLHFASKPDTNFQKFGLNNDAEHLEIWSIIEDQDGFLWVATYGAGVFKIDIGSSSYSQIQFVNRPEDSTSLSVNNVSCVVQTSDGSIWAGTFGGGLNKFRPKSNSYEHWYSEENNPKSLAGNSLLTLLEDSYGFLWIGTYGDGLTKLDISSGYTVSYKRGEKGLEHNTILSIFEDSKKDLWVGTDGGGLCKYIRDKDSFQVYSNDAFPSNIIQAISEDDDGYLWLSTNQGLVKFDPSEGYTRVYTQSDGLLSNVFNSSSSFKDDDGRLYFGTGEGFNYFYPNEIIDSNFSPPVHITDFKILNQSIRPSDSTVLSKDIKHTEEITLSYVDKVFSFEFVALDYTNPKKLEYAYKLAGFDERWVYTDAFNRSATYTNLNPGYYQFQVKSTNSDGIWSEKTTSLAITILPPPWLTWWAYTLYALLFLGVIFLIIRAFVIRERLKSAIKMEQIEVEKMHELDQMKTRFFTNISHEFRTPLTLIITPISNLLERSSDAQMKNVLLIIKRNATRLLGLINELLDLSKLEAGHLKLTVSKVETLPFLKILIASFTSLAESKDIDFNINLDCGESDTYFDKEKLEKIINNLLSNAIKFTPNNGTVSFTTKVEIDKMILVIQNSGAEISIDDQQKVFERFYQTNEGKQSAGGTGVGLALVKELVELHRGSIELTSEKQKTVFSVEVPVARGAYTDQEVIENVKPLKVEASLQSQNLEDSIGINVSEKSVVLVVEDNDDLRNYIGNSFRMDFKIVSANNGKQGLELARETIPDIVVSDFMMPVMDGLEMLESLRNDHKTSHIPLIMLTAKADLESRLSGIEAGADHYITKPFEMSELSVRVNSLLQQRVRVREHYRLEFLTSPSSVEKIDSADDVFLRKLVVVLDRYVGNHEFSVDAFAKEMAMSRVQLHRKLKATIGCSTSEFIRQYRLKLAYQYLLAKKGSVSEIAYEVGFNNLSYFAKCFKETFQINPSEVEKSQK